MFTLGAFNEDRASAVTTLEPLDAVDDDHLLTSGDDLIVPPLNKLVGVYAFHGFHTMDAGSPRGCRIASPSLRRTWPLDIARLAIAEPPTLDGNIEMFPENPLPLEESEALNALMKNNAITDARGIVGVWLADGVLSPIRGEIRTIRCTSSLTGVANVWTSGPLTASQDLPVGKYQLVGARVYAYNTWGLYRFIIVGATWRPGGVTEGRGLRYAEQSWFRRGKLGVWGEFSHRELPRLEILSPLAASDPEVYLDLLKVA